MTQVRRTWPWLMALAYGGLLVWIAPLGEALQFGGDEGYELMKGLLRVYGFELYREIWSDQPPLHTELLHALFCVLGPSVLAARLLSVAFAVLMVGAFCRSIQLSQGGSGAAAAAGLLLVLSPHFAELSVLAMIVLPSMAIGFLSVFLLFRGLERSSQAGMFVSGGVLGVAMHIKLSAGLLIPAMVVLLLAPRPQAGPSPGIGAFRSVLWWTAGCIGGVVALLPLYPRLDLGALLGTHFGEATRLAFALGSSIENISQTLLGEPGVLGAAFVALVAAWRRRDRRCLFPAVLLATVLPFHAVHRPYWYFYDLHLSIPLTWLAGIALAEGVEVARRISWAGFRNRMALWLGSQLVWPLVLTLLLVDLPRKVFTFIRDVSDVARISDDPEVQALRRIEPPARWCVAGRGVVAFHANVPHPPELAVISRKRIISGLLSPQDYLAVLTRYEPDVIMDDCVYRDVASVEAYLKEHYSRNEGVWIRMGKLESPPIR